MEPQDELVVIHTYLFRHEAQLAHSVLDAFGIASMISADDLGGEGPGVDLDEGVRLMVRAEDVERAREVLKVPRTKA